jgi:hypothetical protein
VNDSSDGTHEASADEAANDTAEGPQHGGSVSRGYEPTGNPTVDAVLQSLERLDDAAVEDHVGVFESAHERLRGALADAGNDDQRP